MSTRKVHIVINAANSDFLLRMQRELGAWPLKVSIGTLADLALEHGRRGLMNQFGLRETSKSDTHLTSKPKSQLIPLNQNVVNNQTTKQNGKTKAK